MAKIRIPFTEKTLIIGKKEVQKYKESVSYGRYMNTFSSLFDNGYKISFDTLYTIYNNLVDVKGAIRRIKNAVMKEGYNLRDINRKDKEGNAKEVNFFNTFINTNDFTFERLVKDWAMDLHIAGNAFWHIVKNINGAPLGIKRIDPRTMVVLTTETGKVVKYVQRIYGQDLVEFAPDEIIHSIFDPSTDDEVIGCSPIESIVWEGRAEMSAQMTNFYFYENNAVPSHFLILEEDLDNSQIEEIQKGMEAKFSGSSNAFKAGIIPYVKDIKTVALSQKEMQYIEGRNFSTKKVCVAFGVDPFLLGYTEKVQRGNAEVVYSVFYEDTIRPLEKYLESLINKRLLPALGIKNLYFEAKLSNYDDEQRVWDSTRQDVLSGIMTINEARQLRGLRPIENELADELLYSGMLLDDLGAEMSEFKNVVIQKKKAETKRILNLLDV